MLHGLIKACINDALVSNVAVPSKLIKRPEKYNRNCCLLKLSAVH